MGWGILQHSSEDEAQQHCCLDCCLDIEGQNHRWGSFWRSQQWGSLTWLLYARPVLTREEPQACDGHGVRRQLCWVPVLCAPERERRPTPESHPLPPEYPWPQPGAEQKETNDLVIAAAPKV